MLNGGERDNKMVNKIDYVKKSGCQKPDSRIFWWHLRVEIGGKMPEGETERKKEETLRGKEKST